MIRSIYLSLTLCMSPVVLVACGWVDSTGSQASGVEPFSNQIATGNMQVIDVDTNTAPRIASRISGVTLRTNVPVDPADNHFDFSRFFFDPDEHELRFTTSPDSFPASRHIEINSRGEMLGTPTAIDVGEYSVTLIATDSLLSVEQTFSLTIIDDIAGLVNSAPYVAPIADVQINRDQEINVMVSATDADGDNLSYRLSALAPEFIKIDRTSGRLYGNAYGEGRYVISVVVRDDLSSTRESFFLDVLPRRDES